MTKGMDSFATPNRQNAPCTTVSPWSMAFVIPGENVDLLKKKVPRIKSLFNVDVNFTTSFEQGEKTMQWINFFKGESTTEEMRNAKTYITSMTSPETSVKMEDFTSSMFELHADEIESRTRAFLKHRKKSNRVVVKGSNMAVFMAQSMLTNLQPNVLDKAFHPAGKSVVDMPSVQDMKEWVTSEENSKDENVPTSNSETAVKKTKSKRKEKDTEEKMVIKREKIVIKQEPIDREQENILDETCQEPKKKKRKLNADVGENSNEKTRFWELGEALFIKKEIKKEKDGKENTPDTTVKTKEKKSKKENTPDSTVKTKEKKSKKEKTPALAEETVGCVRKDSEMTEKSLKKTKRKEKDTEQNIFVEREEKGINNEEEVLERVEDEEVPKKRKRSGENVLEEACKKKRKVDDDDLSDPGLNDDEVDETQKKTRTLGEEKKSKKKTSDKGVVEDTKTVKKKGKKDSKEKSPKGTEKVKKKKKEKDAEEKAQSTEIVEKKTKKEKAPGTEIVEKKTKKEKAPCTEMVEKKTKKEKAPGTEMVEKKTKKEKAPGTEIVEKKTKKEKAPCTEMVEKKTKKEKAPGTEMVEKKTKKEKAPGTKIVEKKTKKEKAPCTEMVGKKTKKEKDAKEKAPVLDEGTIGCGRKDTSDTQMVAEKKKDKKKKKSKEKTPAEGGETTEGAEKDTPDTQMVAEKKKDKKEKKAKEKTPVEGGETMEGAEKDTSDTQMVAEKKKDKKKKKSKEKTPAEGGETTEGLEKDTEIVAVKKRKKKERDAEEKTSAEGEKKKGEVKRKSSCEDVLEETSTKKAKKKKKNVDDDNLYVHEIESAKSVKGHIGSDEKQDKKVKRKIESEEEEGDYEVKEQIERHVEEVYNELKEHIEREGQKDKNAVAFWPKKRLIPDATYTREDLECPKDSIWKIVTVTVNNETFQGTARKLLQALRKAFMSAFQKYPGLGLDQLDIPTLKKPLDQLSHRDQHVQFSSTKVSQPSEPNLYTASIQSQGKKFQGTGINKKQANNDAARKALEYMLKTTQRKQAKDASQPEQEKDASQPEQEKNASQPEQAKGASQPEQEKSASQPEQEKNALQPKQTKYASQPEQEKNASQRDGDENADVLSIEGEKDVLRHIVIDGNNVAMSHGIEKTFSVKGIQLCLDYFLARGHKATAFVSGLGRYIKCRSGVAISDHHLVEKLEKEGLLKVTPHRRLETGKIISSYDDRFVLNLAIIKNGIVVSNDHFRDLVHSKPGYKEIIETRLLPFMFVDDVFLVPDDPLGRDGPTLDQFLRNDCNVNANVEDSPQNGQSRLPSGLESDVHLPPDQRGQAFTTEQGPHRISPSPSDLPGTDHSSAYSSISGPHQDFSVRHNGPHQDFSVRHNGPHQDFSLRHNGPHQDFSVRHNGPHQDFSLRHNGPHQDFSSRHNGPQHQAYSSSHYHHQGRFHQNNTAFGQFKLLKEIGLKCRYDLSVVESALKQCDLTRPVEQHDFVDFLKFIDSQQNQQQAPPS